MQNFDKMLTFVQMHAHVDGWMNGQMDGWTNG